MQQRSYDPAIGRFLSVDPVTADGRTGSNFNRYWYANNSPYTFSDPDGRIAYQVGNTIYIPVPFVGSASTQELVDAVVSRTSKLWTQDATKSVVVPVGRVIGGVKLLMYSRAMEIFTRRFAWSCCRPRHHCVLQKGTALCDGDKETLALTFKGVTVISFAAVSTKSDCRGFYRKWLNNGELNSVTFLCAYPSDRNNALVAVHIGCAGHISDAATGLTYMHQRYYDPTIGRFLRVDLVTADGRKGRNFNRYWYANSNLYKFIGPDGRLSDHPDRDPRGGAKHRAASPELDRINYQNLNYGGAPTGALGRLFASEVPEDRIAAAQAAIMVSNVKGNSDDLSYEKDLKGVAAALTDPSGVVELGPDAFTSWIFLSMTLGHEFEVHVPDFHTLGYIQGCRDSDQRELTAHEYEINNARRFKISPSKLASVKSVYEIISIN